MAYARRTIIQTENEIIHRRIYPSIIHRWKFFFELLFSSSRIFAVNENILSKYTSEQNLFLIVNIVFSKNSFNQQQVRSNISFSRTLIRSRLFFPSSTLIKIAVEGTLTNRDDDDDNHHYE